MATIRGACGLVLAAVVACVPTAAARDKADKKDPDKAKAPDPAVNADLLKALTGRDPEARAKALQELAKLGAEAVPTLRAGLKASDPESRVAVLALLGKLGADAKPALPEVSALLKDASLTVRRQTALTLAGRLFYMKELAGPLVAECH
jgi:HEAT repeat protein